MSYYGGGWGLIAELSFSPQAKAEGGEGIAEEDCHCSLGTQGQYLSVLRPSPSSQGFATVVAKEGAMPTWIPQDHRAF